MGSSFSSVIFCSKGLLGERADGGAHGGEAVAAGGRERAREVEELDGISVGREDFGRSCAAVEIRDKGHETADDR